jgi:hypothetical protein
MKRTLATVLAVAGTATALGIAAGCGSSDAQVPTGADLKGTWTIVASAGSDQGKLSSLSSDSAIVITAARGQAFAGYKTYTDDESGTVRTVREPINGAIAADGDILMTEEDGIFTGTLEDGVLRGQYAEVGPDNTAMNVEYTQK